MEAALGVAARWLDAVGIGGWSDGVYPIVNVLHLLGLVLLVGGIGVVDLRVAGVWRAIPAAPLARALTPVAVAGLAIMVASGTVLFASDGAALARSDTFRTKLFLIALALANAALFRWRWRAANRMPAAARASALLSIGLWLGIAYQGRMIAYT